jgi:hypothetical protein
MCRQARWGACNGHLGKRLERISGRSEGRGTDIAGGELELDIDRGKSRRGDPDRDHKTMHCVHEHDAGDRAVEPNHIKQPRDVEVDSNTRECLRQQDDQQDQTAPGQQFAAERIPGRNGEAVDKRGP